MQTYTHHTQSNNTPPLHTYDSYALFQFIDTDYRGLLLRLHGDGGSLQDAYTKIDQRLKRAAEYVKTWYNYQALWDMDLEK
ncbi:hypothetical protein SARC_15573, partial [Sphaeroforma arctica JP610]